MDCGDSHTKESKIPKAVDKTAGITISESTTAGEDSYSQNPLVKRENCPLEMKPNWFLEWETNHFAHLVAQVKMHNRLLYIVLSAIIAAAVMVITEIGG